MSPEPAPLSTVVFQEGGRGARSIINQLISPRAIAWVSTRSSDGIDNLAPHSYVTVASTDPLVVSFTSIGVKDTLRNVLATGEFVIGGVPRALKHQANISGAPFARQVSEFDAAGVTRAPSRMVSPCGVKESPFAIECRLREVHTVGNGSMVLGDVLCISVSDAVIEDGRVSSRAMDLMSRGGGDDWYAVGDVWRMQRPSVDGSGAQAH